MARTLKRLSGPALLTGAAATIYTVPASTVTVITNIHVANVTAGAIDLTLSLGANASGTQLFKSVSIPANQSVDLPGPYIMTAAEVIQALGSATNSLNVSMYGYELTNN